MSAKHNNPLEDVAVLPPEGELNLALEDVSLENVQMQVRWQGHRLPGRSQAGVSLIDGHARGIHMSRLFKVITEFSEQDLTWPWLSAGLDQMLSSHQGLSDAGYLDVSFELPVLRQALLSGEQGWRSYPVRFRVAERRGHRAFELTVKVLYSSTCPCSASLARQAMRERFAKDFAGQATVPIESALAWLSEKSFSVPHSQRSEATVKLSLQAGGRSTADPLPWIDWIESALGTPVQTAVKREDEQEFARLNALNLMFCEDAARRIKAALQPRPELADFAIEVRHFESLHAHDVVARVGKF